MGGLKKKDGLKKKSSEGDLFPRGAAPSATPRVRKRDGQVLFAPSSKRARPTRPSIDDGTDGPDLSADLRVTRHGATLSAARLSPGMTLLALVVRADRLAVNVVLPSGINASASPDEMLVQPEIAPRNFVRREDSDASDEDSEAESNTETDSSDDDDAVCPLWQTVHVGQVVRVALLSVEQNDHGRRAVKVSFKPDLVNVGLNPAHVLKKGFPVYAAVRSVEDHGYVLSFGAQIPTTGFLPFDKWRPHDDDEDVDEDSKLAAGHPVEVVVEQDVVVPKKKAGKKFVGVAQVSGVREKVLAATVSVTEQLNYHEVRAGMLVPAKVIKEGPGGVALNAFGVFKIAVDASHVPRLADGTWDVKVGNQMLTRILCVDASQKRIVASLLESFVMKLMPRSVPADWKIGTVMKKLKVEQVKPGFGLIMSWAPPDEEMARDVDTDKMVDDDDEDAAKPDEDHAELQVPVFAHISRVSDTKDVKLESRYHKDMIVTDGARVVSVSRFDGMVNVDLRPSILARKALSVDEIEVGSLYDCKVMSHTTLGSVSVAVDGDTQLPGIVPSIHVSDVPISQKRLTLHENLRIGATLRCRALFVNLRKGKVILSAKKSIVSPKYPLLTSLEQASNALGQASSHPSDVKAGGHPGGAVFSGSVSKVLENGSVVISFCGQVAGLVPRSELCLGTTDDSTATQSEVENLYPIGQTVQVRLTKVYAKMRRLWLSMNLQTENRARKTIPLKLGQFVNGTITKVDEVAKHFVVLVKIKPDVKSDVDMIAGDSERTGDDEEKSIDCHLPFGHVGDTHGMTERIVADISKALNDPSADQGDSTVALQELMVLSVREQTPVLTLKQSLKDATISETLPRSFDDVLQLVKKNSAKEKDRTLLSGYVKALLPSGVIVGFLGNAVGFARKSRIADHFVSDPGRSLKINQSVAAVVDSIDKESQRFLLSLRLSDVGNDGLASQTLSLFQSFETWENILQKPHVENSFSVGSIVDAEVGAVHTYGVTFKLKSGKSEVVGVALDVNEPSAEVFSNDASSLAEDVRSSTRNGKRKKSRKEKEGGDEASKQEKVRIIDVDPFTGVVDVSRDAKVVAGGAKKSILNIGSVFNATVLLVKSSYIILAVARSKTRSAIAFALGPTVSDNLVIRPGTSVQCTVLDKSQAQTRRNLVVIDWQSFRTNSLKKSQTIAKDGKKSDYSTTISLLRDSGGQDESLVVGKKLAAKVTRAFPLHVFVGIAQGIVGQIHATNVGYLPDEEIAHIPLGPVPSEIAARCQLPDVGSKVGPAYIAGVRTSSDSQNSSPIVVELSLAERRVYLGEVSEGQKFLGFVKNVSSRIATSGEGEANEKSYSYTRVAIGPSTVVTCTDVNCLLPDKDATLKIGSPVICLITDVQKGNNSRLWGTVSENGRCSTDFFMGIVQTVDPGHGLKVEIPWHARDADAKMKSWGTVALCDIAENFDDVSTAMATLQKGDTIRVRKLAVAKNASFGDASTWLSMRSQDDNGRDPVLTLENAASLEAGAKLRGFVAAINKKGCFVSIGRGVSAHVLLCDLADNFVKEPEKEFPVGKVVDGCIGENKKQDGGARISLVLRKRPRKILKEGPKTGDLKEGTKVTGTVKRVEAYGALVEVSKSLNALLHKSEADQDRFIENPAEEWTVGQQLTAIVIKVDGKGVKLGTKRCYFEAAGLTESQIDELLNSNACRVAQRGVDHGADDVAPSFVQDREESDEESDSDVGEEDDDASGDGNDNDVVMHDKDEVPEVEDVDEIDQPGTPEQASDEEPEITPLSIGQSFSFSESANAQMSSDAEDKDEKEDTDAHGTSPSHELAKRTSRDKREKKRLKEATEKAIRLREEALAKNPDSPETAADFERLLVGEPNCSVLWIRYMAFCLSLHQVDKARSIAERALETISLNEEADRTNVWIAYLNLEAQYGASNSVSGDAADNLGFRMDAAVFRVFDRACERVTDVENFHLQGAAALRATSSRVADEILRRATRKFKRSKTVWIASGQAQFKADDKKSGRRTLEKALASLDKGDHVAVISKFAQLEYKYGTAERGRTVFESLAGNFPKRLDLWNIYLDMEAGQCKKADEEDKPQAVEATRNLFEKCTTLNLSSKKMKFVFQKWLSFEKQFGTKEQRADVKNKAREYVERSVSTKE